MSFIVLHCEISLGLNYSVTLTKEVPSTMTQGWFNGQDAMDKILEQKLTRTNKRASGHQLLLHYFHPMLIAFNEPSCLLHFVSF